MPKRLGNIIPDQIMCKFKATDTWTPTAAAGGVYTQFYANNPYDPVVGVSSTACSGFDEMMALFEYGVCYACKVTAKFLNQTESELAYIYFTDSSVALPAAIPGYDQIVELNKDIRWKHNPVYAYNTKPAVVKYYRTLRSLENERFATPVNYRFTLTGGPAFATGVQVGARSAISGSATAIACQMFIKVVYYCKLYDRKTSIAR